MPDSIPTVDVLVVGAGPTGLTMAAELARRGAGCRVVDVARGPTDRSKAIGVQARTLEVLENMGLAGEFTAQGHRGRAFNLIADGHPLVHLDFHELDSPFPYLLLLPQSETERILLSRVERLGLTVEREVRLTGFTQDGDGVMAALQHPGGRTEEVRARWLVGCDGAHSTVRHTLGLPFTGEEYEEGFQLADVQVDWALPEDELHVFLHAGWLLAAFPLPGGRYRLIADVPPEQAPLDRAPTLEECQTLMDARGPGGATLRDPAWTANYRIHRRIVSQLRAGRAFLVGDAAHIHSPAGAQGMNTGMQDAFNLAWKLALVARGASPDSLLDSYQAERLPVEQDVLRGTDFLLKMVSLRQPLARKTRDTLLPLLTGLDVVQQRIRAAISELAVHYPHSPLTEEHHFGHGPRAGERAPDAALTLPNGAQARLFELLRDGRHTLLLFSGPAPTPETLQTLEDLTAGVQRDYGAYVRPLLIFAEAENRPARETELHDLDRALHTRYGADAPCLYLIRPDGYIAFRNPTPDGTLLRRYLQRLFLSPTPG